ncbi:hypothetical protein ABE902_12130 [Enterococcus casseliflavus]
MDAADMEEMNIGQCLDYIQEWIENNTKEEDKPKAKGRRATQADFNNF